MHVAAHGSVVNTWNWRKWYVFAHGVLLQQFNRVLFPARHAPDVLEMLVFDAQIGARDPRDSFKNLTSRAGGCAK